MLKSHLNAERILTDWVGIDAHGGETLQLVGARHGEDGEVGHVEDVERVVAHDEHPVDGGGGVQEAHLAAHSDENPGQELGRHSSGSLHVGGLLHGELEEVAEGGAHIQTPNTHVECLHLVTCASSEESEVTSFYSTHLLSRLQLIQSVKKGADFK